ncbi:MAG: BREX system P-loop protein BrxC [Planctomycetales bacterium]|nr:BREX system P-loop protein BrxC [Planctomycetales bacterium]
MKNRELFLRDPVSSALMNNGQARINDGQTEQELLTLKEELTNFVCEGQYEDGAIRILESYIRHFGGTSQPAAWVSGFFGSGKSHLLKMLCHLWVDTEFPDGSRARSLPRDLPDALVANLKELDTLGRRYGGLHSASGTLPSGANESVRLTVLGMIFRSKGLPEKFAQAKFCLYLKNNGFYDKVKAAVESKGKDFFRELNDLYVSPILHDALVEVDSGFGDRKSARATIKTEFVQPNDVSTKEFIETIREVISVNGQLPCTIIVLDEVQVYIGEEQDRARDVVEVAEALSKQLDCRIVVIGAGQNALSAQAPHFQWLKDRFTIPVELSDTDVETVTRRVLLQKEPNHVPDIRKCLDLHAGEIERQLSGTRIASTSNDRNIIVEDYPLLPTRRRFWEYVFRAVDPTGTSGMLRSQLRIIHDALQELAELPLGTVVPADFMFEQLQPNLVQQGVLLRELDETIRKLDDNTPEGKLKRRICGLIFLIRKIPRNAGFDIGIRATPEMLADLLVSDLRNDGSDLRKQVPLMLDQLVEDGVLLKDETEYNLQTKEYSDWDREYRNRLLRFKEKAAEIHSKRNAFLRAAAEKALKNTQLAHDGERREKRRLALFFGDEQPVTDGETVPVWIRDHYSASEKAVLESARAAGVDSPIVYVFLPGGNASGLWLQIERYESAVGTIQFKGEPSTPEGEEAKKAMLARRDEAARNRDELVAEIIDSAKVFKGGGSEVHGITIEQKIVDAGNAALVRMFPDFKDADYKNWPVVITRAKAKDDTPLHAIKWTDEAKAHPVCKAILKAIGSGAEGRELHKKFGAPPYGWPQDAVDGALMALHNAGDVSVRYSGEAVSAGNLDQTKIKKAEFRQVTRVISAREKLALCALFQSAGVAAKSSDDLESKSRDFIDAMLGLASHAGGEAPLPPSPDTQSILDLRNHAGNERLGKLLEQESELKTLAKQWRELGELAEKRLPNWKTLDRMLRHAADLPGVEEIRSLADGVRTNRLLLDTSDHVSGLVKKCAELLRASVTTAHATLKNTHDEQMSLLTKSDVWTKLTADQQSSVLSSNGITDVAAIKVGTDDELLRTLDSTPLSSWGDKSAAIPGRFSAALAQAGKLLEPKLQQVRLTSGTLKTPEDIKQWLAQQETELVARLKNGPIIIS